MIDDDAADLVVGAVAIASEPASAERYALASFAVAEATSAECDLAEEVEAVLLVHLSWEPLRVRLGVPHRAQQGQAEVELLGLACRVHSVQMEEAHVQSCHAQDREEECPVRQDQHEMQEEVVRDPCLVHRDVVDHRVLAEFLDRSHRQDQAVACTQEYGCDGAVTRGWNDNCTTINNQVISMY